MRPILIGVGGSQSSAGKTEVACNLLRRLNGWGAIKYTRTNLYSSITDDPNILKQKGKDTERLIGAGAEEVLWVQSAGEALKEILPMAIERLSHLNGITIEGNSAIEVLMPDIVIFVFRDAYGFKTTAENTLKMADVIIGGGTAFSEGGRLKGKPMFSLNDEEGYIGFIRGLIDGCKDKRDA